MKTFTGFFLSIALLGVLNLFIPGFGFSDGIQAAEYYVDITYGDDLNDGLSWSTAKKTILNAVTPAIEGDVIYVAAGDYIGGNIPLKVDMGLLGGYPPGGGDRDPDLYETVIDVSRGTGSCVIGADFAVVDGFTLIRGTGTDVGGTLCGGGVLCNRTSPTISNNIIKSNTAGYGAGIYCNESSARIRNNRFIDNEGGGGGIYLVLSDATIWDNLFIDNTGVFGGAIQCDNLTAARIENNVFWNNFACCSFSSSGGAIYCLNFALPLIINNTFMANNSSWKGGAIYCNMSSIPIIRNNIFYDNNGEGVIASESSSAPTVDHNVFWNNTGGVYWEDYTSYATVSEMDTHISGCSENLACDPHLRDPVGGDYHLRSASCCIDVGNPDLAPDNDIDGDTRPQGSGYDIGADEYLLPPLPLSGSKPLWLLFVGIAVFLTRKRLI